MQRKWNGLLLLLGLLGAAIGYGIGEALMRTLPESVPSYVTVGLYVGAVALFLGLGCLAAELASPKLNGFSWRQRYADLSWKLLIPATLVLLFIVGGLAQFIFGLEFGGIKKVRDIVLVIDNSGSMTETDPANDRYKAAKSLIEEMDKDKRVAVVSFHNTADLIQPFARVGSQAQKESVYEVLDSIEPTEAGTNFYSALSETLRVIEQKDSPGRGTMVILMSDGFSDSDIREQIAQFKDSGIAIHAVGLKIGNDQGVALLQDIADSTGGNYYDVSQSDGLSAAFQDIYMTIDNRMLLSLNPSAPDEPGVYKVVRLISFVVIGLALGLSLGLMFDNRFLALSFGSGGVAGGLLAGLILNAGLSGQQWNDSLYRLLAFLAMAAIIAIFTLIVPVGERKLRSKGREVALNSSPQAGGRNGRRGGSRGF